MKVATIDYGYSDGYLRSGSNRAKVYIDEACNVVGRVSMDLITIDVSHIDQIICILVSLSKFLATINLVKT